MSEGGRGIARGSQSILGKHPDAPRSLRASIEADVFPKYRPDLSPYLAENLGEISPFHITHGTWVDGGRPETGTIFAIGCARLGEFAGRGPVLWPDVFSKAKCSVVTVRRIARAVAAGDH